MNRKSGVPYKKSSGMINHPARSPITEQRILNDDGLLFVLLNIQYLAVLILYSGPLMSGSLIARMLAFGRPSGLLALLISSASITIFRCISLELS
jgi:hypothetical protein